MEKNKSSKGINFNKQVIKKYKIPYELFPTETGKTSPQLVNLYDNCIFVRVNLDITYGELGDDGEVEFANMVDNSISYISKNSISRLSIVDKVVLQYNETTKEDVKYNRPCVSIATDENQHTIWFENYDLAVDFFNDITNWRYND